MNDKDLKKLNRQELLELLLSQSKKIDRLQHKLTETERKLKEKEMAISEAGNIADAAMRLSGFFDAAQKAADVYIEQCRLACEKTEQERDRILSEAKLRAEQIVRTAQKTGRIVPDDVEDGSVSLPEENTAFESSPTTAGFDETFEWGEDIFSQSKSGKNIFPRLKQFVETHFTRHSRNTEENFFSFKKQ